MNIYLHELRSYRKNTFIWIVALSAAVAFLFMMFPAFSANAGEVTKAFERYPKAVQAAFSIDVGNIGTVPGFYSFIITFLTVCGAVQAMNLGISVIAKETTGKTADFLHTKPVSRWSVITSKLLAVFTCVTVTSAVFVGIATAMAFAQNKPFDYTPFLMMSLSFFFVQVIFLAVGFVMAVVIPRIKSVLPVSLSTVFGFFIIGTVAAMLEVKDLNYLSPFKYFDSVEILKNSAYEPSFVIVGAAIVALAITASYVLYSRKDIHAA